MDSLCCHSMASEILDARRITSGLPDFVELVMRASQGLQESSRLNRVMVVCRDDAGYEFDCEIRAVAGQSSAAVVWGDSAL